MAIFVVIIYFGLQAGFSLLKLYPLRLGSCLNSCNRNELRFPRKENVCLPVNVFVLLGLSTTVTLKLNLERDEAF